ncbi:uncharacterized protein A4U43_C10F13460 [Asparagus officinalis]|uniref:KAT8 regulatory NSL complex subunit 2 n=1 Tax=Asparagus officinalis TaxID=4686 RepID=A0A5P1E2R4_ASPOF|nr:INO80 complex subunit D-like isoform X2 [Asparagus officinalis]ONK56830.1 uncharacterized protein A4U43_C10F13460 [Asparagus officinalis]
MAALLPSPQIPNEEETSSSLATSSLLSREEVLRRRSHRSKALYKRYRSLYWVMMEEIRAKHRKYLWDNGSSPLEKENGDDDGRDNEGLGEAGDETRVRVRSKCACGGCKMKAMPLTRFCHQHILTDPDQTLYKRCVFVTKSSGQNGPCGKPILRAVVPSLCHAHSQRIQKNVSQSLKKFGVNLCSSSRPTSKFSAILIEYIHNIQAERRKSLTKRSKVLNSSVDSMIDEKNNVD